jgi:hypothetical protein
MSPKMSFLKKRWGGEKEKVRKTLWAEEEKKLP